MNYIPRIPPIKIQGIKTKLVGFIKNAIESCNYNLWIEPFMGSGVVGFNLAKKDAVFSDINPYIIDFYNNIKNNTITHENVRCFLNAEGKLLQEKGEEYYYLVRERFNKFHNPLDFLFLNRSNFNGMIRFSKKGNYNVPYGHKPNRFTKSYITKICNQIYWISNKIKENNWNFICQSFENIINEFSNKNSLIYCDPPYINRNTNYYDSWNQSLEINLYNTLIHSKSKFVLSTWMSDQYKKNDYISDIWSKYTVLTYNHFYFVGGKIENRNPIVEAILKNF